MDIDHLSHIRAATGITSKQDWRAIVARKQAEREALIAAAYDFPASQLPPLDAKSIVSFPVTCGLLTSEEVTITEIDDVDFLLAKLAKGERWARELDEELKRTGKTWGPLHGLPISVKDQFQVRDSDATIAYVSYVGRKAHEDSVCVSLLKKAGAVPFVKTNLPQTIMSAETRNELFGAILNPHNRLLHAGGSSGGEGALVSIKGSPLGVGTDVGGSMEGQESIPSVIGPLARSLLGLKTFTKAILDGKPWLYDPLVPEMQWRQEKYDAAKGKQGLKIGLMTTDLHVHPFPPFVRALARARDALTKAGHTVVPFSPYEPAEGLAIMGEAFAADGGKDVLTSISGCDEPLGPQVTGVGQEEKSAYDLWQINRRKNIYRKKALDHWREADVDFVLCPTSIYPAMKLDTECWILYTGLWNLLDYSAISLPVTTVDAKLDRKYAESPEGGWYSETDKRWNEKYDPELLDGAPIGVQVVAGRYNEEEVLGYAETVWNILQQVA